MRILKTVSIVPTAGMLGVALLGINGCANNPPTTQPDVVRPSDISR